MRAAGTYEGPVWNLETEQGVYVAGGALVHNCQFFAAGTFFAAADPFPAKYRIGISADERRRDGREYLIRDLFGDVAVEFGADEAVEQGVTHDVQVLVVPTGWHPGPWHREALASGNPWRIRAAQKKVQDMMAASEPRAEVAAELASRELREGRTVALLADRREHCGLLASCLIRRGHRPGMMIGGPENAREFGQTRDAVRNGSLRCAVGTVKAIGTGIDVPAFDRGLVCSHVTNNEQLFGQIRGRFCRTSDGKDGARLYVLWDRELQGQKAVRNLAGWCRDVRVLDRGSWVPARDFLRHRGAA